MGTPNCDECGTTPYLGSTSIEESLADGAELWCDCPTSVDVAVEPDPPFTAFPEYWGMDGGEVRCYHCGEVPEMHTTGSASRNGPVVNYRFGCRCDNTAFGPRVKWNGVMPDKWKDDADYTKWPWESREEIYDVIDEHGPIEMDEIQDRVDLDDAGVRTLVTRMDHGGEIHCNTDEWEYATMISDFEYERSNDTEDEDDGGILGWL
jgi:hypothetical protein